MKAIYPIVMASLCLLFPSLQVAIAKSPPLIAYQLESSERYLASVLQAIPANNWMKRADTAAWSAAGCAEHLLKAEQGLLTKIQHQISTQSPDANAQSDLSDAQVLKIVYDRVNKQTQTAPFLEPSGLWSSKEAFWEAFKAHRKQLNAFIKDNETDLSQFLTESPIGTISLEQNLLVIACHTARHVHQMEAIQQELGNPNPVVSLDESIQLHTVERNRMSFKTLAQVLILAVESGPHTDTIQFSNGNNMTVRYEDKAPDNEAIMLAFRVNSSHFESIKHRLIALGASSIQPESTKARKAFHFNWQGLSGILQVAG